MWTALNVSASGNSLVGQSTDENGIIGEIRIACSAHPSMRIGQATTEVYDTFRDTNR
jgi:hypothetical protein